MNVKIFLHLQQIMQSIIRRGEGKVTYLKLKPTLINKKIFTADIRADELH